MRVKKAIIGRLEKSSLKADKNAVRQFTIGKEIEAVFVTVKLPSYNEYLQMAVGIFNKPYRKWLTGLYEEEKK